MTEYNSIYQTKENQAVVFKILYYIECLVYLDL